MSFIPSPSPSYYAPASFNQLQESGALKVINFDCKFKRLKRSEADALDKEVAESKKKKMPALDAFVLARVCEGWRVREGEGDKGPLKEVPFTKATLDAIEEESPGFTAACVRSFYLSMQPMEAAHLAEKNS